MDMRKVLDNWAFAPDNIKKLKKRLYDFLQPEDERLLELAEKKLCARYAPQIGTPSNVTTDPTYQAVKDLLECNNQAVLDTSKRMANLIELVSLIDECLLEIDQVRADIINYRYGKGMKIKQVYVRMELSKREYLYLWKKTLIEMQALVEKKVKKRKINNPLL